MLDHIFLTVGDIERVVGFYEAVMPVLGISRRLDYDGSQGPAGHLDLKGFGANGRVFFWLRAGHRPRRLFARVHLQKLAARGLMT